MLGDLADESKFTGEPALVEIVKIELICPERPAGNIRLDFKEVIKFMITFTFRHPKLVPLKLKLIL